MKNIIIHIIDSFMCLLFIRVDWFGMSGEWWMETVLAWKTVCFSTTLEVHVSRLFETEVIWLKLKIDRLMLLLDIYYNISRKVDGICVKVGDSVFCDAYKFRGQKTWALVGWQKLASPYHLTMQERQRNQLSSVFQYTSSHISNCTNCGVQSNHRAICQEA